MAERLNEFLLSLMKIVGSHVERLTGGSTGVRLRWDSLLESSGCHWNGRASPVRLGERRKKEKKYKESTPLARHSEPRHQHKLEHSLDVGRSSRLNQATFARFKFELSQKMGKKRVEHKSAGQNS